jgi:hypothetical protein
VIKLQQYHIFKLATDRLKQDNYDIQLDTWQARKNGELVSIGDSQMLRTLREITGRTGDIDELQELLVKKHNLKRVEGGNFDLYNIENRIDELLFVSEIISLVVKNVKQYEYIISHGLFVNNKKYVRLMCSAGQARRNNVLFVDAEIEKELKRVLNNDRADIEITPAKFNAYFALASSTALPVTTPYFCVIPDCEVVRKETVDWVTEVDGGDDIIEPTEKELTFNLFDGQGIISPRMAEVWANDLGLDYIPGAFIIRSNFIKGMVAVIDFMEYSDEIGKHIVKDVYGNDVNIRDMDVILTASQFKLWNAFDSMQDYVEKCRKNNLGWGVTRCTPKEENTHTFLNYQFLQALHLDQKQIESLCSKTVEYFENVMSGNKNYTLLYLLGAQIDKEYDENIFNKINDNVTKALMLDNNLITDPYIQNHIQNSLRRKIKDSYIGNLIVDGQYTFIASDPLAMLEYIFGQPIVGLLKRNEHYNNYWLSKGVNRIAGMRSPLVWRSEVNVLDLKNNDDIQRWYKYLKCCLITNVHGLDMALFGGCDFDGDILCLTNQQEIINGAYGGLPVMYETRKAPKCKIVESELYKADLKGFNTKVGFLTNLSTTMYSMLPMFAENSLEYKEIIRRLKQCRKQQGTIIDSTKGLDVNPIPPQWSNWQKIKEDMSQEEIDKSNFNNSILVEKRPQFMENLYPNYGKDYRKHCYNYDILSQARFKMFLSELIAMDKNLLDDEQKEFLAQFYRFNPLLDTSCEINSISKYMQKRIGEIKVNSKLSWDKNSIDIMKKRNVPDWDDAKSDALILLHEKYKSEKRNFGNIKNEDGENRWQTIEQYNKSIRQEALKLSSDLGELAYYAIARCYVSLESDNKAFVWSIFGDGVVDNIKNNIGNKKIEIPFLDDDGDIEYLGKKYSRKEIKIVADDIYDFL